MKHRKTLVLNNAYMPLSLFPLYTIPAEDAITRYLTDNCDVVEWYPDDIKTVRDIGLKWPSVIANHNGNSFKKDVRLKKESLFYRDHCVCQYCGKPLTVSRVTFDHVDPRAKGGKHSWENVVASCKPCNNAKSDDTSGRWKPKRKPYKPSFYEMLQIRSKYPIVIDDPSWAQFLPNWTGEIIVRGDGKEIPPYLEETDEDEEDA
jgi:5-methylcytosine-specific restriction endonuclease McrA